MAIAVRKAQSTKRIALTNPYLFTKMNLSHTPFMFSKFGNGGRRRGVAAVELAICLPVMVLLVIGTIEACSMIFLKQSLAIAAYEGARTATIAGATTLEVKTAAQQVLTDRSVSGGIVTLKPVDIAALNPGEFVDVTVSAPCSANSIVPIKFYLGKTLTSTASMMIEF